MEQVTADLIFRSPDEIDDGDELSEGTCLSVRVNRYERDPVARKICIDRYSCRCVVCGFDFEDHYGPIGRSYIHVHHLTPLSQIGRRYAVDPIKNLRPVCPNCHAMLHRSKDVVSVKALQKMLKRARATVEVRTLVTLATNPANPGTPDRIRSCDLCLRRQRNSTSQFRIEGYARLGYQGRALAYRPMHP